MLDLKATYVWLKELIKNALSLFWRIFFNILVAFSFSKPRKTTDEQ